MVSIPRLNRIQPSADRPTGRIKFKAQDRASSITGRTGALSNLAQEGGRIANAYENEEIDSKSTQDEAEYTVWKAQALDVLKENKGDPTKLYADHDLADEEKRREILGRHKDLSERAIRGITSNFKKVEDSERLTTLNQRGRQKAIFKNNLVKTNLELRGKNLSLKASSVVPGKEGSFFFYGKNIHDITTILAKQGIDNGSVEVLGKDDKRKPTHEFLDADKNVVRVLFNKNSALGLNQELDKRITTSIENLIASGNSDKAVAIQTRYSKSIHPDNHARITKALKVNKDSDESFKVVEGLVGKSKDERNKILKKLTPEVRHKVKRLEESNAKLRNIRRNRRFKVNHEALDKFVDSSDLHSFEALKDTPQYKKLWPNLDRKGRDAIKDKLDSPTEDDLDALINAQDIITGVHPTLNIEDMDGTDWNKEMAKLSKSTVGSLTTRYLSMKTPKETRQVAFSKRARKALEDQLVSVRHIKIEFGKIRDQDRRKLIDANNALIDVLHERYEQGEIPSEKELTDFVKELAVSVKRKDLENFKPTPKKFKTVKRKKKEEELPEMSRAEKKEFMLEFMKSNSGNAPTEDQLNEFIKTSRQQ